MDTSITNLISEIEVYIKEKSKKIEKNYKPTKKTIEKIGNKKDIKNSIVGICMSHFVGNDYKTLMDEFIGIKPYSRIAYLETLSKQEIENKCLALFKETRSKGEAYHEALVEFSVFPLCRRLEFLYTDKKISLVNDEQCLEIYDLFCIYFRYVLYLHLKLTIDDTMIEATYDAILTLSQRTYSKMHRYTTMHSSVFILKLASVNPLLYKKLLMKSADFYQKNKIFLVESLTDYKISEYAYLLSDKELSDFKSTYIEESTAQFNKYKLDPTHSNPTAYTILSTLKKVQSWTNKYPEIDL
jgi:hypothetical protein